MRMHSVAPEIKLQLEYQMTVVHVIMEPFGIGYSATLRQRPGSLH